MKKRLQLAMSLVAIFGAATLFAQVPLQDKVSNKTVSAVLAPAKDLKVGKLKCRLNTEVNIRDNTTIPYDLLRPSKKGEKQNFKVVKSVKNNIQSKVKSGYIYYNDFNSGIQDWTCFDVDGLTVDPALGLDNLTGAGWVALSGVPSGIALAATSFYSPTGKADDWAISPQISIPQTEENVNLYWLGYSMDKDFKESYEVRIFEKLPTKEELQSASTLLLTVNEEAAYVDDNCNHELSLNDYKGKTVYLAYRLISADRFLLCIDNMQIVAGALPPTAFYDLPKGIYAMSQEFYTDNTQTAFYGPGLLVPVEKEIQFSASGSERAASYKWIFEGVYNNEGNESVEFNVENPVVMYPYPIFDGITPELQVVSAEGKTSDYFTNGEKLQAGSYAIVYNFDAYIPEGSLDIPRSSGGFCFGYDKDNKPVCVEMYEAPVSPIYLNSLIAVMIAAEPYTGVNFKLSLYVANEEGQFDLSTAAQSKMVSVDFISGGGDPQGVAQFNFDTPYLVDKAFCITLEGPQDGSCNWVLFSQNASTRMSERNTAYIIPTIGEGSGQFAKYNMNTSLALYTQAIQPFMYNLVEDGGSTYFVNNSIMGLDMAASYLPLYLYEFWGGGVTIKSNDSWITISDESYDSKTGMTFYKVTFDATSEDRVGSITVTNKIGYSKNFYFGQGESTAISGAPKLNEIQVINKDNIFMINYPEGINSVEVVNVAGQVVSKYPLEGTSATIPAANLAKGLYLLKFNTGATVKVMK